NKYANGLQLGDLWSARNSYSAQQGCDACPDSAALAHSAIQHVASCKLQAASCKLQAASCKLK
ncbi:MAG: hypothetical protein V4636_23140, partial [Pseudomonadota bacterium]